MALKVKPTNASRSRNRLIGVFLAIAIIIFVSVMSLISSAESKKTISVVKIKPDAPITANSIIREDMLEVYDMYYKEFEQYGTNRMSDGTIRSTLVRWDERADIVGKRYAAYYLRGGTVLFWDSTVKEQTKKNSYLYNMSGELLNIKMNTVQDFGDMVVPGDTLNIRANYTDTVYNLPTELEYKLNVESSGGGAGEDNGTTVKKTSPLFSEVTILDMLNSAGQSIFDIYYNYISSSKQRQGELLKSPEFLESVKPNSILIECTAEEVEHYMALQGLGATYQMTLLPRTSSSNITDSLSEIQNALAGISGKAK